MYLSFRGYTSPLWFVGWLDVLSTVEVLERIARWLVTCKVKHVSACALVAQLHAHDPKLSFVGILSRSGNETRFPAKFAVCAGAILTCHTSKQHTGLVGAS
jgi:hypothetical protein